MNNDIIKTTANDLRMTRPYMIGHRPRDAEDYEIRAKYITWLEIAENILETFRLFNLLTEQVDNPKIMSVDEFKELAGMIVE